MLRTRLTWIVVLVLVSATIRAEAQYTAMSRTWRGRSGVVFDNGLVWVVGALEFFDFAFTDGDHFLNHIALGRIGGPPWLAFLGGKFHQEPFRITFRLRDFTPVGELHWVERNCTGYCVLPIPPVPRDRVLVLSGFDLQFHGRNDHQIRLIGVSPEPESGRIIVNFGNLSGTGSYRAGVAYTLVPWHVFTPVPPGHPAYRSPRRRWDSGGFRWSTSAERDPGIAVLQGFSFAFVNGVQNVLAVAVNLRSNRIGVTYTGDEPGQPARAVVNYVIYPPLD